MAKSVLYMSMSLDGFITGPDDGPGNGLGNGGHRLHEWLGEPVAEYPHFDPPGLSGQVFAELLATAAVVVGRKTFDYAGRWGGDHHGVPIFVPTRGTPPEPQSGWVHYLPDAAIAMHDAKAAAGDQDVMVHGAGLAQSLLREGLLDELEIHLIPVVLGGGRRLFGADRIELELTRVLDAPASRTCATGWRQERPQADPADVGLMGGFAPTAAWNGPARMPALAPVCDYRPTGGSH